MIDAKEFGDCLTMSPPDNPWFAEYAIELPDNIGIQEVLAACPSKINDLMMSQYGTYRCISVNVRPVWSHGGKVLWQVKAEYRPAGLCDE